MAETKKLTPEEATKRAEEMYAKRGALELGEVITGRGGRDKRPWFIDPSVVIYMWAAVKNFRSAPSQFSLVTPDCELHRGLVPIHEFSKMDGASVVRRGDTILLWAFRKDVDMLRQIDEANLRKSITDEAVPKITDRGDRSTVSVEASTLPGSTRTAVDASRRQ